MQTYRFGCWRLSNWLATYFSFIFARQYHATHAAHRLRNARVAFQLRVSSPLRGKAIWDRRRGGTGLWVGLAGRTSRRSRQPPPGTNADGHWLLPCPSWSHSRSLTLPPLHVCFLLRSLTLPHTLSDTNVNKHAAPGAWLVMQRLTRLTRAQPGPTGRARRYGSNRSVPGCSLFVLHTLAKWAASDEQMCSLLF